MNTHRIRAAADITHQYAHPHVATWGTSSVACSCGEFWTAAAASDKEDSLNSLFRNVAEHITHERNPKTTPADCSPHTDRLRQHDEALPA